MDLPSESLVFCIHRPMSERKSTSAAYRRMETHPGRRAFQWRTSTSETIEPARRVYASNQLLANLQTAQGSTNSTSPFSVVADLMMALAGHCNPKSREAAAQRLNEYPEFHVLVLDCREQSQELSQSRMLSPWRMACCILPDVGCCWAFSLGTNPAPCMKYIQRRPRGRDHPVDDICQFRRPSHINTASAIE